MLATTDQLKFYVPLNTEINHFIDVLPSHSLSTVLTKLNLKPCFRFILAAKNYFTG